MVEVVDGLGMVSLMVEEFQQVQGGQRIVCSVGCSAYGSDLPPMIEPSTTTKSIALCWTSFHTETLVYLKLSNVDWGLGEGKVGWGI